MWAAKSGHAVVVEYLISSCNAFVDMPGGWVKISFFVYENILSIKKMYFLFRMSLLHS